MCRFPAGKESVAKNKSGASVGKAGNAAANQPVRHIATNAGGVAESNAFISKFALAAESNQTAYPAPCVTQIGTNLFAFATISNVDCSQYPDMTYYDAYFEFGFSQDAPGPRLQERSQATSTPILLITPTLKLRVSSFLATRISGMGLGRS